MDRTAFYRTIWRWHFYAGLFVMPFVLLLSLSGTVYLFKPQIDRWEERAFQPPPGERAVSPNAQLDAALKAYPGARFDAYRLPEKADDPAMIRLIQPDERTRTEVFVSPGGTVLGSIDPTTRIIAIARRLHGQLLLGPSGSWLVELAACWAIVMILTGLALWWPRGGGLAGVVWPRLGRGPKAAWRDLHAVAGFWVSGLALVLLLSGLPWASAWGNAFQAVRTHMGWVKGTPDWTIGGEHAGHQHGGHQMQGHDHAAMMRMEQAGVKMASLADIVTKARAEHLAPPVLVTPPGEAMVWTAKSDSQNRPLRRTVTYDSTDGRRLGESGFADQHPIDRVVGYGVAWHEGALFGAANVAIGVFTALAMTGLSVTGFIQWRRRKPSGSLGAPPAARGQRRFAVLTAVMIGLAILLPLFALSLVLLAVLDRLVLPRLPGLSRWTGLAPT